MKEFTYGIVAMIIIFLLTVYHALSWGFVCFKFWDWFLLPIFPSVGAAITYWQAVGLSFFFVMFKNNVPNRIIKDEYTENKGMRTILILMMPWIYVAIASLFKVIVID